MTSLQRTSRNAASITKLNSRRLLGFVLLVSSLYVWLNVRLFPSLITSSDGFRQHSHSRHENIPAPLRPNNVVEPRNQTVPQSSSSYDNGMSACLLVMDDNHFLIEWIAFHYHTLPLRYLVIAVDPRSKTSPTPILKRWRNRNITIVQWGDREYMSETEQQEAQDYVANYFGRDKIGDTLIQHRARQRLFYYKCMKHLKERNRDWVLLTDSDEFVYLNYAKPETINGRSIKELAPPISQRGSVLTFLKSELGHLQTRSPSVEQGNKEGQPVFSHSNWTTPCIQIPRIRFGAVESTSASVQARVPPALDGNNFLTLHWRTHAHPNDYGVNRISKVLIDLSRVPRNDLKPVDSIHRPIRSICGHRRLHIRKSEQVLVINHYLGTLKQYSFRDDSRQGNERSVKVRDNSGWFMSFGLLTMFNFSGFLLLAIQQGQTYSKSN